jgi:hypothetical protein
MQGTPVLPLSKNVTRRLRFVFVFVALFATAIFSRTSFSAAKSDSRPLVIYQQFRAKHNFARTGAGVMFFVYGRDEKTFLNFADQVVHAAREFKRLAPSIPLAVATSSRLPNFDGLFDYEVIIDPRHDFPGSNYQKRPDALNRQWLTRILYMTATPFEMTVAYDSNVMPCRSLNTMFRKLQASDFDIATASVGTRSSLARHAFPHNFAIAYRWNARVSALFDAWFAKQVEVGVSKDDQNTLFKVLLSHTKQSNPITRKTLSPAMGLAFASTNKPKEFWPRETRVISTAVAVIHEDPRAAHELCELYDTNSSVRRQFIKTSGSSVESAVYSSGQCADALGTSCLYSGLWDDVGLSDLVPAEASLVLPQYL